MKIKLNEGVFWGEEQVVGLRDGLNGMLNREYGPFGGRLTQKVTNFFYTGEVLTKEVGSTLVGVPELTNRAFGMAQQLLQEFDRGKTKQSLVGLDRNDVVIMVRMNEQAREEKNKGR